MTDREKFEKWISAPPYEKDIKRFPDEATHSWPGQYREDDVQLAWEAVEEARKG